MPRKAKLLSPVEIRRLANNPPTDRRFRYTPAGGVDGLYFRVADSGACYWVLKYVAGYRIADNGKRAAKRREYGLGGFPELSLKTARETAAQVRQEVRDGGDPVEARREARKARQAAVERHMTFSSAVEHSRKLMGIDRTTPSGKAWENKIGHVEPVLGPLPVLEIERKHIVEALLTIWHEKNATARRARGVIEDVLDRAYAKLGSSRQNPARNDKVLNNLLPDVENRTRHFAALPYNAIQPYLAELKQKDNIIARALEFIIYTAVRAGAICQSKDGAPGLTWKEIDLDRRIWTIPASRMKMGEEHRVPLSQAAMDILNALPLGGPDDIVFPTVTGKFLRDTRISKLAQEVADTLGFKATTHGFRAVLRSWGEAETDHPAPVLEMTLGHKVSNDVVAAYQRSDLWSKRKAVMDDWATYCGTTPKPGADIVKLREAR